MVVDGVAAENDRLTCFASLDIQFTVGESWHEWPIITLVQGCFA